MYRLVFLSGSKKGRRLTVQQGDVLMGSAGDCHVRFRHPSVLNRHAVIEQRPEGFFIRALSSGGKVVVNDEAVVERQLNHRDEIDIGAERLLFQLATRESKRGKRRVGHFSGLAYLAVGSILVVQILILIGLFMFWRMDPIQDVVTEPVLLSERLTERLEGVIKANSQPPWQPFRLLPEWWWVPTGEL